MAEVSVRNDRILLVLWPLQLNMLAEDSMILSLASLAGAACQQVATHSHTAVVHGFDVLETLGTCDKTAQLEAFEM